MISPRLGAGMPRQAGQCFLGGADRGRHVRGARTPAKWPMTSRVSAGLRDSKVSAALGRRATRRR